MPDRHQKETRGPDIRIGPSSFLGIPNHLSQSQIPRTNRGVAVGLVNQSKSSPARGLYRKIPRNSQKWIRPIARLRYPSRYHFGLKNKGFEGGSAE
jgi:hypothetical protein